VKLADRVAQCRSVLAADDPATGGIVSLSGAASCAAQVASCPLRYVLSDQLTELCTEMAFSRGARDLACADLLHVPAEAVWLEWCNAPWLNALQRCGFSRLTARSGAEGRRGVLIRSCPDGRRGTMRTFWSDGSERGVLASSMEAHFDFDTREGEEPEAPDRQGEPGIRVYDQARQGDDLLVRYFRFRYERSWSEYYAHARLSSLEREALKRHVLGTIALDIPVLLAFLLLLASRSSLPRHRACLERLNQARLKSGKVPLLDCIDVGAPLLPEYLSYGRSDQHSGRRGPRLHHVRGHLVRRGSALFWRIPHLRGSARSGMLRARTVTWTFEAPAARGKQRMSEQGPAL
jgi:hypothetical protein